MKAETLTYKSVVIAMTLGMGKAQGAPRKFEDVKKIIVHKHGTIKEKGKAQVYDPVSLVQFHLHHSGTKDAPYHYIVWGGRIYFMVSEGLQTPHARKYNRESIGIAVLADYQTVKDTKALIDLLDMLSNIYSLGPSDVYGHTELKGASSDPKKVCPAPVVDMDYVRAHMTVKGKADEG